MKKTVVTHSSRFHADDVCAVAVLQLVFGESELEILRTRDTAIIEKADIVVDVGGVYDVQKNRFDHHQITFNEKRENGIPYASFGLVWKTFGEQLCGSVEGVEIFDKKVVQPIDASDNGVQIYDTRFDGVHPYLVNSMLYSLMPSWKEEIDLDEAFLKAVNLMKQIMEREIIRIQDSLEAQKIVDKKYNTAVRKDILVFEKEDTFGDEDVQFALTKHKEPLFFIRYRQSDDNWSVKAVWSGAGVFSNRLDFPEAWAALENEALQKVTGVADAIFCHRGRFLCVAKSLEGARALAEKAVQTHVDKK
jgi:uncharacterized UPF0160 family protein